MISDQMYSGENSMSIELGLVALTRKESTKIFAFPALVSVL